MNLQLVIGNKNYSSWSMRAWLFLKHIDAEFEEIPISVYVRGAREEVQDRGGETGLVPVLIVDGFPIWDTFAIAEFLHESFGRIWPSDVRQRARARSYAGEVHSGLSALRNAMPVNCRGRARKAVRTEAVEADIERVIAIWSRHREGSWLFGDFCGADIMFAPVATRFRTYGVSIPEPTHAYMQRLLTHPLIEKWFALGEAEATVIPQFELPAA